MPNYDPASYFGSEAARRYDDHAHGDGVDAANLLADLAGDGPALEFASQRPAVTTDSIWGIVSLPDSRQPADRQISTSEPGSHAR